MEADAGSADAPTRPWTEVLGSDNAFFSELSSYDFLDTVRELTRDLRLLARL
jgi:hypothetical protein